MAGSGRMSAARDVGANTAWVRCGPGSGAGGSGTTGRRLIDQLSFTHIAWGHVHSCKLVDWYHVDLHAYHDYYIQPSTQTFVHVWSYLGE